MKLTLSVLLIAGTVALPGYASTPEASSKQPDSKVTPTEPRPVPVPKTDAAESKPVAEPLKWDRLDPKAIEQSREKEKRKSPFATVPAER